MLLGLINLGSSSAFTAFVSVGVIALAVSYAIPIILSLLHARREVDTAKWGMGRLGWGIGKAVNLIAVAWISFELVLFSMPTALPVTATSMNYASVVFAGFLALAGVWYLGFARKGVYFFFSLPSLSLFLFLYLSVFFSLSCFFSPPRMPHLLFSLSLSWIYANP